MARRYGNLDHDEAWSIICGKEHEFHFSWVTVPQNNNADIRREDSSNTYIVKSIPKVDARNEMIRWRINPQSIYDYDPIEDGKESISLALKCNGQENKIVYEAYGTHQYNMASAGGSLIAECFCDPAVNHRPIETSAHPGFKASESFNASSTLVGTKETIRHAPVVEKFAPIETSALPEMTGKTCPNNPDFEPHVVPAYVDFNRTATPFKRNALK